MWVTPLSSTHGTRKWISRSGSTILSTIPASTNSGWFSRTGSNDSKTSPYCLVKFRLVWVSALYFLKYIMDDTHSMHLITQSVLAGPIKDPFTSVATTRACQTYGQTVLNLSRRSSLRSPFSSVSDIARIASSIRACWSG